MKLTRHLAFIACVLTGLWGCTSAGGSAPKTCDSAKACGAEKPPAAGSEQAAEGKSAAVEAQPEEREVKASPESVLKVKRLLRRRTSGVLEEREEAWKGLKDMGDLATPALIEVIRTGKTDLAREAIIAVGLLKDRMAAGALREAMSSEDAGIRWCAARALGEVGDLGAKDVLAKAVREDRDPEVRYHSAYALASIDGQEAFDFFKKLSSSDKVSDRARAVRALGTFGKNRFVPELIAAMKDPEARVRRSAIIQLDRAHCKEAVPGLIASLVDEDRLVRKRARSSLERISGKTFGRDKGKWEEWWAENSKTFKPVERNTGFEEIKFANAGTIGGPEDFKKLVKEAKGLVAVDFYSLRGRNCAKYAPVFDKLVMEFKGRVPMYCAPAGKAMIGIIKELKLRTAPTTVIFRDGEAVEKVPGFREEAEIRKIIEEHLAGTRKVPEPEGKLTFSDVKDQADFKAGVLNVKGVVLVDFHADWCGWCHKLAPILNKLAEEYKGRVTFVGVDADKSKELKEKYGVRGLPTMLIFKAGEKVEDVVGFRKEEDLKKIIDKHLEQGGDK